jgi:tetratricopeptide (TPR) repeat protein
MAWFVRGGRLVDASSAAELASFSDYLTRALKDADAAAAAGLGDPHGFLLKLRILRGFGLATEAKRVFEAAIEEYPGYYPLYDTALSMQHPKWGGSTEGMYAFVDHYAGRANEHSPLKLLYLSLYRHLLNYSATSCATNDLEKLDDALRDFKAVADSPDSFRATAAIDVSMILFDRKDIPGALAALNEYTYLYDAALYDAALTAKQSIAVAYNNRCYAYMELGELMKALEDCKTSLKYGNLPDAYRKQLELIKRLGTLGNKF